MIEQPQLAVCGCCNSIAGLCGDLPCNQHCYCCPLHPATREVVKPRRSVLQEIADHYRRLAPQGYARAVWTWEGRRAHWAGTVHCPTRADLPGCASPRRQPAETWPDDTAARAVAERIRAARAPEPVKCRRPVSARVWPHILQKGVRE